jgi:hypothetical protein
MKKSILVHTLILLGSWSCITTQNVGAQQAWSIGVVPRFGLISPDTYFYEVFANFADDEPTEWTNGALGRAAVVGLGLEVGLENRGFFLRGEIARSFSGWLLATHGIVRPRVLFDPPQIVNTWLDIPASVTFANLQVVLPAQLEVAGIQPFFLAGGGGKWYSFGEPRQENTVEAILPSEGFTASLELGAGIWYSLFGLNLEAQVRDSINKYWSKTQHDLVFSGGLRWRIR